MSSERKKLKTDMREFNAYKRELTRLCSPEWITKHAEIVNSWWCAGIVGGMFRAGVDYGKRIRK